MSELSGGKKKRKMWEGEDGARPQPRGPDAGLSAGKECPTAREPRVCMEVFTRFVSVGGGGVGQQIQALTYFPQLQWWQLLSLLCAFLIVQLAQ